MGAWPPFCIYQQYVFTYFPLGYFCPISELKELVNLHKESTDANEDPLRDDEVMIIQVVKQILSKSLFNCIRRTKNALLIEIGVEIVWDNQSTNERILGCVFVGADDMITNLAKEGEPGFEIIKHSP